MSEMERWVVHTGDARDIDGVNVVVYVLLKVDGRSRRSPIERDAMLEYPLCYLNIRKAVICVQSLQLHLTYR